MKILTGRPLPIVFLLFVTLTLVLPIPGKTEIRFEPNNFANYDKCILKNVGNLKDRSALSTIKSSCFNLNHRPVKIPKDFWNTSIRFLLVDVNKKGGPKIVGTDGWTQITVTNNTNFRITSVTLRFDGDHGINVFNLMTHPFTGYNDIDHLHIPSYSQRDHYYVDLRGYKEVPKYTVTNILGIIEVDIGR